MHKCAHIYILRFEIAIRPSGTVCRHRLSIRAFAGILPLAAERVFRRFKSQMDECKQKESLQRALKVMHPSHIANAPLRFVKSFLLYAHATRATERKLDIKPI